MAITYTISREQRLIDVFRELTLAEAWLAEGDGSSASGIATRHKHPQN